MAVRKPIVIVNGRLSQIPVGDVIESEQFELPADVLRRSNVVDNLESTSTDTPLSANQGREIFRQLKELTFADVANLTAMVVDAAAETDSTGKRYMVINDEENSGNTTLYRCNSNVPSGETDFNLHRDKFDTLAELDIHVVETELSDNYLGTEENIALNLKGASSLYSELSGTISGVQGQVSVIDGKVDTNSGNIFLHSGRISTLEGTVSGLEVGVTSLNAAYLGHAGDGDIHYVIDDEGISEGTVWSSNKINSELGDIDTAIGVVDAKTVTNAFDISQLDGRVGVNEGAIGTNIGAISDLTTRMGTAEGQININASAIVAVDGKTNTNASNISTHVNTLNIHAVLDDEQESASTLWSSAKSKLVMQDLDSALEGSLQTEIDGVRQAQLVTASLASNNATRLDGHDVTLGQHGSALVAQDGRLVAVEGDVSTLDVRVDTAESKVSIAEASLASHISDGSIHFVIDDEVVDESSVWSSSKVTETVGGVDTLISNVTKNIYVDGNRTDSYIANGSVHKPFTTISAAMLVASTGDTVHVVAGTYTEDVVVPAGVSLSSDSQVKVFIHGDVTFEGPGAPITIKGIVFTGDSKTLTVNCTAHLFESYSYSKVVFGVNAHISANVFNVNVNEVDVDALTFNGSGDLTWHGGTVKAKGNAHAVVVNSGRLAFFTGEIQSEHIDKPAVILNGGTVVMSSTQVVNMAYGTAIDLSASDSSVGHPNGLADVICVGNVVCGDRPTLVEGLQFVGVGALSGTATVFRKSSHVANDSDVAGATVKDALNTLDNGLSNIDAGQIVSGIISIDRIPQAALERMIQVADEAARFALTTGEVQNGDTVKQLDNNLLYRVVDETKLDMADGYVEYSAGYAANVPWSGVSDTPTTIAGYGITDDLKINDEVIAEDTAWSSDKINSEVSIVTGIVDGHTSDGSIHFVIDDLTEAADSVWSSTKVKGSLDTLGGEISTVAGELNAHVIIEGIHREINDLGEGITDLWSANKISGEVSTVSIAIGNHASDGSIHFEINDAVEASDSVWSSTKVNDMLSNIDAAQITTGIISIDRLPQGALERLLPVADEAARFALTTSEVQNGDTVKQLDNNLLYRVVDDTQLSSVAGYVEYTAGYAANVPWSGVSDTPTTIAGYGITDALEINDGVVSEGTTWSSDKINGEIEGVREEVLEETVVTKYSDDVLYPVESVFGGLVHNVSDEATLLSAITGAADGDIVALLSDITVTSTIVVDKRINITGAFSIQSAGTDADPVVLLSIIADGVVIDSGVIIRHRKTTNTSVECAVQVIASDFVSKARVEFVESGYILKGSFNISGSTLYTGANTNSHRHFMVYSVTGDSIIHDVVFDFNYISGTYVSNFIYHTIQGAEDRFNAVLNVSNCRQLDMSKALRQFYLLDNFVTDTAPSLVFHQNHFDENYGAIGIIGATDSSVLNSFDIISLIGNIQGGTSYSNGRSKGLFYIDGSGALHDIGTCTFYYSGNVHTFCNKSDYDSAYDGGGIAYANDVYNPVNIIPEYITSFENSIYNYTSHLSTKSELNHHVGDISIHFPLNDLSEALNETWSSSKIKTYVDSNSSSVDSQVYGIRYVNGVDGDDVAGDGSYLKPFKTIQACITSIGNASTQEEYLQKYVINISSGSYAENLSVPHRHLTIKGSNVTVIGTITRTVSSELQFGSPVTSAISFEGGEGTNKIYINGNYATVLASGGTLTSIESNFSNVVLAGNLTSPDTVGEHNVTTINSEFGQTINGNFVIEQSLNSNFYVSSLSVKSINRMTNCILAHPSLGSSISITILSQHAKFMNMNGVYIKLANMTLPTDTVVYLDEMTYKTISDNVSFSSGGFLYTKLFYLTPNIRLSRVQVSITQAILDQKYIIVPHNIYDATTVSMEVSGGTAQLNKKSTIIDTNGDITEFNFESDAISLNRVYFDNVTASAQNEEHTNLSGLSLGQVVVLTYEREE